LVELLVCKNGVPNMLWQTLSCPRSSPVADRLGHGRVFCWQFNNCPNL